MEVHELRFDTKLGAEPDGGIVNHELPDPWDAADGRLETPVKIIEASVSVDLATGELFMDTAQHVSAEAPLMAVAPTGRRPCMCSPLNSDLPGGERVIEVHLRRGSFPTISHIGCNDILIAA
jgi:hypothetical protein